MEEHVIDSCSIVYFASSAQDDLHELYHKQSPPAKQSKDNDQLSGVYHNVCALLDEDRGGFNEVFLCSRAKRCRDRLDSHANSTPTIVLIELHNVAGDLAESKKGPISFLRALSGDIHGARFQKYVLPFVLLRSDQRSTAEDHLDADVTTACFQAGAVDILENPLRHDDINRMIGHYKETNRPPASLVGAPMAQNLVDSIHDVSRAPREASYRPDEALSHERKAAVESAVSQWHFPAQDFNMDELTYAALFMIEHVLRTPELAAYVLERPRLIALLLATRRQYKHEREVHYHNWRHAVDVTQCVFSFLLDLQLCPAMETDGRRRQNDTALERVLTPLDGLILLISAIGHDVGHPGVNNAFLVACNHPLAQTYNDKSVLENYHCAAYQQLLRRHWPAINQTAGFRATMISTILATDMQRHFEYMSNLADLKAKVEKGQPSVDEWSDKEREHTRELILSLLIKAADISNVARPFDIAAKWARTLMYEFARQGELESELAIPTCLFGGPPNTEDILAAAQSQMGFRNLFGFPLFQGITEVLPALSPILRELERNSGLWEQRINEGKQQREPPNEDRAHFGSVSQDTVEEAEVEAEHRKSDPTAVPLQAVQSFSKPTKRVPVEGPETSPSKHGAHSMRQQLASGIARDDDKRSSAPVLGSQLLALSSAGISSRRSSKDVALEQLQQTSALSHQSASPGSRRGSTDAGCQIHQSYPSSRRGSKDESLTTIMVTSGSTPNRRSSPSSPTKKTSPGKPISRKQSVQSSQKQVTPRTSAPARSHVPGATMPTAGSLFPSAQPSSPVPEFDTMPPAARASIPSTEDPFMSPGNWPNDVDGTHTASPILGEAAEGVPSTPPPPPQLSLAKSESSRVSTRETDDSTATTQQSEHELREVRSRSRLRGLKFWKKRRDVTGFDPTSSTSGSP